MSVASLMLGQRVYVERDWSAELVGAWGTVVRECWGRQRAWVRLDERHARCPFPGDMKDRATWILTVPDSCSSLPGGG